MYNRSERYDVLNIVYIWPAYGDHTIVLGHNGEIWQVCVESILISFHGETSSFSVGPEFFNARTVSSPNVQDNETALILSDGKHTSYSIRHSTVEYQELRTDLLVT